MEYLLIILFAFWLYNKLVELSGPAPKRNTDVNEVDVLHGGDLGSF